MNKQTFKLYLAVRPRGIGAAVRLYTSYVTSFLMILMAPNKFKSTGYYIPGRSNLTVSIAGVLANVMPRTNSLGILAGVHEAKTTTWFKVQPGDVVVDVGAHIGRYALIAARRASKVIAIEPEPSNFSLLVTNIALNGFPNVVPLRLALTESIRKRHLYMAGGGDTGTSSLEPDWTWVLDQGRPRKWVEIDCVTLDHLTSEFGVKEIDWLKIDVEGHEVQVLEGSRNTLTMTRRLILEVAEGNEEACWNIVRRGGLRMIDIDKGKKDEGLRSSSNWLLVRD